MKKIILLGLMTIAFLGCDKDDEDGCKCRGEFSRFNSSDTSFFADNVDCDTGQPVLDNQNQGSIGESNPAFYRGCVD